MLLSAVCPDGLVTMPGGGGCACDAGHEPATFASAAAADAADAVAAPCTPCAAGTAKAEVGDMSCSACVPGQHQPRRGAAACDPCAPSTFSAGAGATDCAPCEAGYPPSISLDLALGLTGTSPRDLLVTSSRSPRDLLRDLFVYLVISLFTSPPVPLELR